VRTFYLPELTLSDPAAVNFNIMPEPEGIKAEDITEDEQHGIMRTRAFTKFGVAYGLAQATRPSTVGLALSASPVGCLAWSVQSVFFLLPMLTDIIRRVAEKFHSWSDITPSTSEILQSVSLYWLTSTISSSLYTYRQLTPPPDVFPLPKNSGSIACQTMPARADGIDDKPKGHEWKPW
jgi:microsomal epoxide hydrolase